MGGLQPTNEEESSERGDVSPLMFTLQLGSAVTGQVETGVHPVLLYTARGGGQVSSMRKTPGVAIWQLAENDAKSSDAGPASAPIL